MSKKIKTKKLKTLIIKEGVTRTTTIPKDKLLIKEPGKGPNTWLK